MSRPNLPPSANDFARLLARVENLERRDRRPGPRTFGELDDVDATAPADQTVATYVAASGKIELAPGAGGGFPVGPEDDGTGTAQITHSSPVSGTDALIADITHDAVPANVARTASFVSATDVALGQLAFTGVTEAASIVSEVSATTATATMTAIFGAGSDCSIKVESTGGTSSAVLTADQIIFPFTSSAPGFGINVASALPSSDPGVTGQLYYDPITNVVLRSP